MKKLSVALYVVLVAAVAVLFVLHFTARSAGHSSVQASESKPTGGIAYVTIDSIMKHFALANDLQANLINKQKSSEAELNSKGEAYQKGVGDYQDKVNKGLVTRSTAAQMEQALLQQQQELVNLRDKLQQDLMEEQAVANRQVLDYITKFLEENKAQFNYQYVLAKSFGGPVLCSDKSYDITKEVLAALNRKYASEKK
ncbi:MAG TPA: OmpH family outer membrane protein [Bacteroidales bacterium]|nr:OmpH family outer membrane protein [Bacteroidales bacterium]